MKQISKFLAPVAMAAAMLWAPQASAAFVGSSSVNGAASFQTYVGEYNPTTSDSGLFSHSSLGVANSFTDFWVFDINPAGRATTNVNFVPVGTVTNFTISLFDFGGGACAGAPAVDTACAGVTTGALLATAGPAANPTIGFTNLLAGRYVIAVSGDSSSDAALYSGQLSTQIIPEPGSLALVGLALMGVAAVVRRRTTKA